MTRLLTSRRGTDRVASTLVAARVTCVRERTIASLTEQVEQARVEQTVPCLQPKHRGSTRLLRQFLPPLRKGAVEKRCRQDNDPTTDKVFINTVSSRNAIRHRP